MDKGGESNTAMKERRTTTCSDDKVFLSQRAPLDLCETPARSLTILHHHWLILDEIIILSWIIIQWRQARTNAVNERRDKGLESRVSKRGWHFEHSSGETHKATTEDKDKGRSRDGIYPDTNNYPLIDIGALMDCTTQDAKAMHTMPLHAKANASVS